MQNSSVYIADRQELIRQGVRSIVEADGGYTVIGEAGNASELFNDKKAEEAELIIFDYHGGKDFTIDDLGKYIAQKKDARVLVISSNLAVTNLSRIMELGVHGILTKTCDRAEILEAMESCIKGQKFFCNKVIDILMNRENPDAPDCDFTKLTNREIDVVKHICEGDTTAEMADKLNISVHTINTHRKNILAKLKIKSTAELMRHAISAYIVTLPEDVE